MNNMNHDSLIDTLIQFEMSMAQMYVACGKTFDSECNKWATFAEEECQHARWLTELKVYLKKEIITLEESRITILMAKRSIDFIKQQTIKILYHNFGLREAVIIALEIENSAIESSFLNIFNFSSPEAEKIRRKLTSANRIHREKFILWLDQIEARVKMVA